MSPASRSGVTLSLLDRLTDLEPDSRREAPMSESESIRKYLSSVCRDLTALLNTRRAAADLDTDYRECVHSVLTYGIADFTTSNIADGAALEQLRYSVERAIRAFEPRLERPVVSAAELDPSRPVLDFQISALLRVEDASEPVLLDMKLRRDSRRVSISEAD